MSALSQQHQDKIQTYITETLKPLPKQDQIEAMAGIQQYLTDRTLLLTSELAQGPSVTKPMQ